MNSKFVHRCKVTGTLAILLAGIALAERASAQVTFFGAQKTQFYKQTADNTAPTAPVPVGGYSEFGFADTTSPGDATGFTLTEDPTDATIHLTGTSTSFSGSRFYNTKFELDNDYSASDEYVFIANGGTLDGDNAELPINADAYPGIVYLTGTNYTDAMHASPNTSFTFDLGYSGDNTGATNLNFDLLDSTGADVFHVNLAAGTTSYTLSQAVIASLTPGEAYTANFANFDVVTGTYDGGTFDGAFYSDGFVNTTGFDFMIVPEPNATTLFWIGLAGFAAVLRFRSRRLKA